MEQQIPQNNTATGLAEDELMTEINDQLKNPNVN